MVPKTIPFYIYKEPIEGYWKPKMALILKKVVSGGQTGVDRAALDAGLKWCLPIGGWCPLGRRAEDGSIPDRYPLKETASSDYAERTKKNVMDSDGTLILNKGVLNGGTALTLQLAKDLKKPYLYFSLEHPISLKEINQWIINQNIQVLNVAGPRESKFPGIYRETKKFLENLFQHLKEKEIS